MAGISLAGNLIYGWKISSDMRFETSPTKQVERWREYRKYNGLGQLLSNNLSVAAFPAEFGGIRQAPDPTFVRPSPPGRSVKLHLPLAHYSLQRKQGGGLPVIFQR